MSLGGFGMCCDGSGAGSCALVMSFGSSGMVFDGPVVGPGLSSSGFAKKLGGLGMCFDGFGVGR